MRSFRCYQAFFGYTGRQKYIKLTQTYPDEPGDIQRCFLLDEHLSIIAQQNQKDIVVQTCQATEEEASPILYTIEDTRLTYKLQKYYQKYPELQDLLIGRQNWGRIENAIKIQSDSISRDHTRISRQATAQNKQDFIHTLTNTIQNATQLSSNWRKLPRELFETIADYVLDHPLYWIQDCSSRNGTYLIDYQQDRHRLFRGEAYEFEHQSYTISVQYNTWARGTEVSKIIQEYQPHLRTVLATYTHNQVIFPRQMSKSALEVSEELYNILLIECHVSNKLKFLYWIITSNEDDYYSIGQGQAINVSYTIHSNEIRRHGYLIFEGGVWYIMGINRQSKVWVRLQPNLVYPLDKDRYKVMIGHHSVLQLQFHNFR